MSTSFYITTPIYYVNGAPHVGHAYTTLVADAFARHYRHRGREVFFLTGTDEHGLKVQRAAEEQGKSPQELVDENAQKFRDLFDRMELTYDRFIRTTDDDHEPVVLDIVERMKASDDIYLGTYEGWYSASDEAYYDEDEVEDGVALPTGSEVEWVEEESYFFRLSEYQDELLEWYDSAPDTVAPEARHNEVRSFVDGGLTDLSISRTTFDWGIEMPDDSEHVLYVWVDALTNYLTGVGRLHDEETFEKFWPCDVHLIGKDILRFHAVYWPAFLMSAGIELPEQVFAHGWWTVEGAKMSKSRGNWIDADELLDVFDLDVLRYFMIREIPFGNDGNFAADRIVERNNSELADNLGNLVNRTTGMALSFLDGELDASGEPSEDIDERLSQIADQAREDVAEQMDARQSHEAVETVMALSGELNQYIQKTQPWVLNREGNTERLHEVLYHALEGIRWVAVLGAPFFPDTSRAILQGLGLDAENALTWDSLDEWGGLRSDLTIEQPDKLFDKLESEDLEGLTSGTQRTDESGTSDSSDAQESADSEDESGANLVEFGTFQQLEFRVGVVALAEPVEGADNLLKLSVDLGEETPRTVVAGIAQSFSPQQLEGLRTTFVTNLEPATLFGIESEAMLLAATDDEDRHRIATYADDVPAGATVS